MVEKMVFQLVRSVESPGGNVAVSQLRQGQSRQKVPDAVVGDSVRPFARFCSAVGSESMNWVSCVPMFDALVLVAWVAAADLHGAAAALVVCGGSVNVVSCDAADDEPA